MFKNWTSTDTVPLSRADPTEVNQFRDGYVVHDIVLRWATHAADVISVHTEFDADSLAAAGRTIGPARKMTAIAQASQPRRH